MVIPMSLNMACETQEMNCGPRSDTMSSGSPKWRKMCWKSALAASKVVGRPFIGMSLDFVNRSTTKMQV